MASVAWERRNARAQALGYSSYYDYRAHNYGRAPASEPRARGPELARLRGHRGPSDLGRVLAGGDVELMNVIQTSTDPPEFEVLVTRSDGSTQTYTIRGQAAMGRVSKQLNAMGPDAPKIIDSPPGRRNRRGALTPDELEDAAEAAAVAEAEAALDDLAGETLEEELASDDDDGIPF